MFRFFLTTPARLGALALLTFAIYAENTSSPLLGRWYDGHVSSIQYRNAYTGAAAPTNGSRFEYDFKSDGTYSFTGLMQSVMYNCTTATFSNESGTYTVAGDSV